MNLQVLYKLKSFELLDPSIQIELKEIRNFLVQIYHERRVLSIKLQSLIRKIASARLGSFTLNDYLIISPVCYTRRQEKGVIEICFYESYRRI